MSKRLILVSILCAASAYAQRGIQLPIEEPPADNVALTSVVEVLQLPRSVVTAVVDRVKAELAAIPNETQRQMSEDEAIREWARRELIRKAKQEYIQRKLAEAFERVRREADEIYGPE